MAFIEDILGLDDETTQRLGNTAANAAKQAATAATAAKLEEIEQRGGTEAEKAGYLLANIGATSLIDAVIGDGQRVPEAYSGAAVDQLQREFYKNSNQAKSTYFNDSVVGSNGYKYNTDHPMYSSLFLVDFEFNHEVATNPEISKYMSSVFPKSMSFLLNNTTFPNASIETTTINSYNKHTIIPKKLNFDPIDMTFTDIYQNLKIDENRTSLLNLFKEYMSYYYNDFVKDRDGYHYGYNSDRTSKQFFKSIKIYMFWSTGAKCIKLVDPFITSFKYSDLDFKEDELLNLTTNIQYTHIELSDLEMSYSDFVDKANVLLSEVTAGYSAIGNEDPNALINSNALIPAPSDYLTDAQRNVSLDNPVAQIMLRLAQVEALQAFGDDPFALTVINGVSEVAGNTVGNLSNTVSSAIEGFF